MGLTRLNLSAGAGTFWKPGRRDGVDQAPFFILFFVCPGPVSVSCCVCVLLSTVPVLIPYSAVGYFDLCKRMYSDTSHKKRP